MVGRGRDSEPKPKVDALNKPKQVDASNKPKQVDASNVNKQAIDALESKDTKAVLDKMKNIDKRIKDIKNMPETEQVPYYGAIQTYEKIKDDIKKKMEEDPNFQEAMKQVGEHLDKNDQPLDTIGEPTAGEMVSEALKNGETPKQIEKANYVISGYDKLNPNQQEALNKGLAEFKEGIENVATQLGLDQKNYEVRKAA